MKNPVTIMSATPEYGIGVARNRFALIDLEEEVDPLELLERKEKEKEEKKKAKLVEKETKSKQPITSAKPKAPKILKETQKKAVSESKIKDEKDKRLPKKEVNFAENRPANNRDHGKENWFEEDSGARENGENDDRRSGFKSSDYNGDGFQRGGRGRRGGASFQRGVFVRGGGRGTTRGNFQRSSFDSRGKRLYDRQSGSDKTGVKPVDKREGSGAHNWGNPQDDWNKSQDIDWDATQEEECNSSPPQNTENDTSETTNGVPENQEETDAEAPPATGEVAKVDSLNDIEEAEKKEMTLDEWKALKGNREQPKYNVRKAGEGEDLSQWKKMFVLEKRKEDEEEEDDEEYEIGVYPQRVGRQKRIYDINIKFKDTRGGIESGGRGRGRGGRGRGGTPRIRNASPPFPTKDRESAAPAPKVDDEKDFPSLI